MVPCTRMVVRSRTTHRHGGIFGCMHRGMVWGSRMRLKGNWPKG